MKRDNPAKHFIVAFVIAVAIYVISYGWIEHRRSRRGPWEVTFCEGSNGLPTMLINQVKLGITNVQIIFPGEMAGSTNHVLPGTLVFDRPRPVPFDAPFGKCIFMDLTFLPGTVTFSNVYGHEIELLPRVLIIDYKEKPWRSESVMTLSRSP